MSYRMHSVPTRLLFGYDPMDLPDNHLVWLIERVVEETLQHRAQPRKKGQPAFDPRLCAKVLLYGYAIGIRSSRVLEKQCRDSLPFLLLTRGDTPSYRTLCFFRVEQKALIEEVWIGLFAVAKELGIHRLGRLVVDSSKFLADASPEAVIKADDYAFFGEELARILQEAEETDQKEEELPPACTTLDTTVPPEQMRDILRKVRKKIAARKKESSSAPESEVDPRAPLGPRMLPRLRAALETLEEAQQEGRKHACLTDPDARMMGEGRDKPFKECHSFEVAVDKDAQLLVAGGVTQETDYTRLEPLVEAAREQEPGGVVSVDADSGYYKGEKMASLEEQDIATCVPDGMTAKRMREGTLTSPPDAVALHYDPQRDVFVCGAGRLLRVRQTRLQGGREVKIYCAEQACTGCPLASACLRKADSKYRTTSRGVDPDNLIDVALARFQDPLHQERYRNRGKVVETVFAFIRHVLGYSRWMVRGKERVGAEGALFKAAYQFRKVYCIWQRA